MQRTCLVLAAVLVAAPAPAAEKIVKETFGSGGRTRAYYLFVPDKARQDPAPPLIVLLHGSGRDGKSLVDKWAPLAKKEGVIIVGPDAFQRDGWRIPEDGPDFLHDLVELLRVQYSVDPGRVYLFGHSAGASHALVMAILESEYFAGIAIHAGALSSEQFAVIDRAKRKIPIAIWVGTDDNYFPLPLVRATRDAFNARGFSLVLNEMKGHTHWYYDEAPRINADAWTFLKGQRLAGEPRFEQYQFTR
jgi:poly(3-hydroxybutyrate) depolymerase